MQIKGFFDGNLFSLDITCDVVHYKFTSGMIVLVLESVFNILDISREALICVWLYTRGGVSLLLG